jgi:hypothetical protein
VRTIRLLAVVGLAVLFAVQAAAHSTNGWVKSGSGWVGPGDDWDCWYWVYVGGVYVDYPGSAWDEFLYHYHSAEVYPNWSLDAILTLDIFYPGGGDIELISRDSNGRGGKEAFYNYYLTPSAFRGILSAILYGQLHTCVGRYGNTGGDYTLYERVDH